MKLGETREVDAWLARYCGMRDFAMTAEPLGDRDAKTNGGVLPSVV